MLSTRRDFLSRAAQAGTALVAASIAGEAWARGERPLRILVGFPPGGGSDVIARLLQEPLSELLGVPVMVENRPGAGGQIAAQQLKAAQPDGSTVFLTHDHTISILPQVVRHPGFDPAKDFVPAGGFASFVNCLAVPGSHPAKTFAEYVQWVRTAGKGRSAIGIPAPASTPEFLVQQLARHFQLDLVAAPYKGSAPMIGDLLGLQIEACIGSVQDFIEYQRTGKLRVLAVLGGQRQAAFPDAPTFGELGLMGLEDMPFYGFYAPHGTHAAWIQRFSLALAEAVARPAIRTQLEQMGLTVGAMTPEQLKQREQAYTAAWKRIIRQSGFHPQ
ncbi:MAG: Bug family tripartite tricarboxylate transporter substrate binding protein [Acidovorax sp.]|jgi:tripartite-type tricarboxylate transporter receptor subunit TctC|nr:Bug family tripartite tricarboxylate transporter substrate binding protein [Acidovorax sp.]